MSAWTDAGFPDYVHLMRPLDAFLTLIAAAEERIGFTSRRGGGEKYDPQKLDLSASVFYASEAMKLIWYLNNNFNSSEFVSPLYWDYDFTGIDYFSILSYTVPGGSYESWVSMLREESREPRQLDKKNSVALILQLYRLINQFSVGYRAFYNFKGIRDSSGGYDDEGGLIFASDNSYSWSSFACFDINNSSVVPGIIINGWGRAAQNTNSPDYMSRFGLVKGMNRTVANYSLVDSDINNEDHDVRIPYHGPFDRSIPDGNGAMVMFSASSVILDFRPALKYYDPPEVWQRSKTI